MGATTYRSCRDSPPRASLAPMPWRATPGLDARRRSSPAPPAPPPGTEGGVEAHLPRHAQDPLADAVALHLVGTSRDGSEFAVQEGDERSRPSVPGSQVIASAPPISTAAGPHRRIRAAEQLAVGSQPRIEPARLPRQRDPSRQGPADEIDHVPAGHFLTHRRIILAAQPPRLLDQIGSQRTRTGQMVANGAMASAALVDEHGSGSPSSRH